MPSYPKLGPWFETRRGWVRQWGGTEAYYDDDLEDAAWAWVDGREYGFSVYDPKGSVISRNERLDLMPSPEQALVVSMQDCDVFLHLWMAQQDIPSPPPPPSVWERLLGVEDP